VDCACRPSSTYITEALLAIEADLQRDNLAGELDSLFGPATVRQDTAMCQLDGLFSIYMPRPESIVSELDHMFNAPAQTPGDLHTADMQSGVDLADMHAGQSGIDTESAMDGVVPAEEPLKPMWSDGLASLAKNLGFNSAAELRRDGRRVS
jgi:hypothetical protein